MKSVKSSVDSRFDSINTSVKTKAPRVHSAMTYIGELWEETFPNEVSRTKSKFEKRKLIAQMQAKTVNMTPEEIEELENSIPDWKKGAVVVTDEAVTEEKQGLFGKVGSTIKQKIYKTSSF